MLKSKNPDHQYSCFLISFCYKGKPKHARSPE